MCLSGRQQLRLPVGGPARGSIDRSADDEQAERREKGERVARPTNEIG